MLLTIIITYCGVVTMHNLSIPKKERKGFLY
jgi:hypothetical protein